MLLCLALFLVSAAVLLGSPTEISCCSAAAFLLRLPGSPPLLLGSAAVLLGSPTVLLSRLLCVWALVTGQPARRKVVHETCVIIQSFIIFGASNHLGDTSKHHFWTQDGKMLQNHAGNAWNTLPHQSRRSPAGASRGGSLAPGGHGVAK